jgi:hypothetical protein
MKGVGQTCPPQNYKPVHGEALSQNIYDQKKKNKKTHKKENSLKKRFRSFKI